MAPSDAQVKETRRDVHDSQQHDERPSPPKSASESASTSQAIRATSPLKAPLTHALPPKPAVHTIPPRPSLVDTSARASSMRGKEKERRRSNGSSKPVVSDEFGPLPPDWEVRRPRNATSEDQVYYFNSRTEVSQWIRPTFKQSGKTSPSRSPNDEDDQEFTGFRAGRQEERDHASPDETRSERRHDSYRPSDRDDPPSREVSVSLSYNDRHYRPSETSDRMTSRGLDQRDASPNRVRILDKGNQVSTDSPTHIDRAQLSRRSPPRQHSPVRDPDRRPVRVPSVDNYLPNERSREFSSVHGDAHRSSRPDLRDQDSLARDARSRHTHPDHLVSNFSQSRSRREHNASSESALLSERSTLFAVITSMAGVLRPIWTKSSRMRCVQCPSYMPNYAFLAVKALYVISSSFS